MPYDLAINSVVKYTTDHKDNVFQHQALIPRGQRGLEGNKERGKPQALSSPSSMGLLCTA
jgi:hypothetical protein